VSSSLIPIGTAESSVVRAEVFVKTFAIFMVNSVMKELDGKLPKLFKT